MVQVHHFKVLNSANGKWEIPQSKRTPDRIAELKGQTIPNTAEEVDLTRLDNQRRYFPSGAAVKIDRPIDEGKAKRRPK